MKRTMAQATCVVCLSDVPEAHRRRKLYSSSSTAALAQLKRLAVRGGYDVNGTNSILPPESAGSSFLCLKCFNVLQRIAKMRDDLSKLEGELETNLSRSAAFLGLQHDRPTTVAVSGETTSAFLVPH